MLKGAFMGWTLCLLLTRAVLATPQAHRVPAKKDAIQPGHSPDRISKLWDAGHSKESASRESFEKPLLRSESHRYSKESPAAVKQAAESLLVKDVKRHEQQVQHRHNNAEASSPCDGVFKDNVGTEYNDCGPWYIGSVWVFGAVSSDGWFKMVSVDAVGTKIENRYFRMGTSMGSMSSGERQAAWDAAHRGGAYSVEVTEFCQATPLPTPAPPPTPAPTQAPTTEPTFAPLSEAENATCVGGIAKYDKDPSDFQVTLKEAEAGGLTKEEFDGMDFNTDGVLTGQDCAQAIATNSTGGAWDKFLEAGAYRSAQVSAISVLVFVLFSLRM